MLALTLKDSSRAIDRTLARSGVLALLLGLGVACSDVDSTIPGGSAGVGGGAAGAAGSAGSAGLGGTAGGAGNGGSAGASGAGAGGLGGSGGAAGSGGAGAGGAAGGSGGSGGSGGGAAGGAGGIGGTSGAGGGGAGGAGGDTFCDAPATVFHTNCIDSDCHGGSQPEAGLNLETIDAKQLRDRDADSGEDCGGKGKIINVAEPLQSLLLRKLETAAPCGDRMPKDEDELSSGDKECVRKWVEWVVANP